MSYIILIFLFVGVSIGFYNSIKNSRKRYQGEGKYLCVPCGYVYDPAMGDPDSGIVPGTSFEDIPETWRCPVCGVTKKDFIPLGDSKKLQTITSVIVEHKFVNNDKNVLLLEVKTEKPLVVQPGQYISFMFHDADGEFRRNYSIVKVTDNTYRFLIRILKPSRGGSILESKKVGDSLEILGVFGNFLLQLTPNKKVFIGTGTGLAPLYHMISTSSQKDNILLFGSKNLNDTFYLEELANLEFVKQVYVYLSREETLPESKGKVIFIKGRMNFEEFFKNHGEYADINTEFYLCGNPNVVHDAEIYLQGKKYPYIFTEKF